MKVSIAKKTHKKLYKTWQNILIRVYSPKYHNVCPTYKDVIICEEWHNLQVFGKWFEENYVEGYHLDKDILAGKSKIYSPNTCVFIPLRLNSFMANEKSKNSSGSKGVSWNKEKGKWVAQICIDGKNKHLGRFTNKENASEVYLKARATEVTKLQELYKYTLPKKVLQNIK